MFYDPLNQIDRRINEAFNKSSTSKPAWMKHFDQLYAVKSKSNSLPYNVVRTETGFLIEMAVAGFNAESIEVTSSSDWVKIVGKRNNVDVHPSENYVHRGIAYRDFEQEFKTVDTIDFVDATLKDGLLSITIDVAQPKSTKVQTIKINQE